MPDRFAQGAPVDRGRAVSRPEASRLAPEGQGVATFLVVTVRLRATLDALPAYVPGRSLPNAIKLASNETPYDPLPHVVERIGQAAGRINRYPDNDATALTEAIADLRGATPDRVVVGCGSVSLCQQLVQVACEPGDEVMFAWRSFEAYPIVTVVGGGTAAPVPLRDAVHDLDAMAAAVTDRTRLILVCNPNNPTGTVVRRAELEEFLRQVPSNVLVALDEAYREFVTDPDSPDGLELLAAHPNLIVLRTFSKAYGLAGLRVGYGIAADPAVAAALRQVQVPFAVTGLAQAAALASLEPEAERQLAARVAEIVRERDRVRAALAADGWATPPAQGNFVWLALGARSREAAATLQERGVLVRPLGDDGVRVTIGAPAENDKFLTALSAVPK